VMHFEESCCRTLSIVSRASFLNVFKEKDWTMDKVLKQHSSKWFHLAQDGVPRQTWARL
jgi:hypothetical protein